MKPIAVRPRELRRLVAAEAEVSPAELEEVSRWRPRTRGQCGTMRPCPWASCRYNTLLEVSESGSLLFPWGEVEDLESLPATCALDVADGGPRTLEDVAGILNMTPQKLGVLEQKALAKLRDRGLWREPEDD